MLLPLRFRLPYPPSVNHYWRVMRGRMVIGRKGRDYRAAAAVAVLEQRVPRERLDGPLRVSLVAYPPDLRRRDLDNTLKALLDAIVAIGVIEDDSGIDDLRVVRGPVRPRGEVEVAIEPIPNETSFVRRNAPTEP